MLSEVMNSKVGGFSIWGRDDTVYNGFPIKYFEPMSYLERIAEWFTNFPVYLDHDQLMRNKDPEWRMKQVVTAVFSTIYMTVKPAKPFNPIIGETF